VVLVVDGATVVTTGKVVDGDVSGGATVALVVLGLPGATVLVVVAAAAGSVLPNPGAVVLDVVTGVVWAVATPGPATGRQSRAQSMTATETDLLRACDFILA
jgi:hypothetical protein